MIDQMQVVRYIPFTDDLLHSAVIISLFQCGA